MDNIKQVVKDVRFLIATDCCDETIQSRIKNYINEREQVLRIHDVSGSLSLAEISKKAKLELLDGMMEQVVMGMADNEHKQKTIDWLQSEINYLNGNDR